MVTKIDKIFRNIMAFTFLIIGFFGMFPGNKLFRVTVAPILFMIGLFGFYDTNINKKLKDNNIKKVIK